MITDCGGKYVSLAFKTSRTKISVEINSFTFQKLKKGRR